MPGIFKKVTVDGQDTYVEVEETEVLGESEAYKDLQAKLKKANDEARDLRLAKKPKTVVTVTDEEESTTPLQASPAVPVVPQQPPVDREDIINEAISRLKAQQEAEKAAGAKLTSLIEKHNLPDSVRDALAEAKNPEVLAEALGRANLTFAGQNTGRSPKGSKITDDARRAFEKLDLEFNE